MKQVLKKLHEDNLAAVGAQAATDGDGELHGRCVEGWINSTRFQNVVDDGGGDPEWVRMGGV